MRKYRKKPIVIDAYQWDGTWEDAENVIKMCEGHAFETLPPTGRYLYIKTLEGDMKVSPSDFIIKGVKGEFYPCKPDIFFASYEQVI
jgi:hypothetical protein